MSGRNGESGPSPLAGLVGIARGIFGAALGSLPLGLLSLGLALVIWVTITNEENPSVRRTISQEVPVEVVNIPRNWLPTNVQPSKVRITVTGARNTTNDVRLEDLVVQVDLSRADEELGGQREGTVDRGLRAEVRRRGVRAEAAPDEVRVTLERQERRTVPVCVDRVDVPPPGFTVEEPIATDPAEATIVGPRGNIDAVECAAAVVRLGGLTVSVTPQTALEPRDAAGRPIGGVVIQPSSATVNVRVKQGLFPKQVVIEPRIAGRPAPGYTLANVRVEPAFVTVIGPLDAINSLTSVPTEMIDVEGARTDIVRSVALQLPPGVSGGERRAVVTATVQSPRAPGTVGATPRVVNLGAGLTSALATSTVAVLVSGPLAEVLQLRPTDVSVTVDATGLGPGTYRLEPRITVPPGISLDGFQPDRVDVTIGTAR